jgi:hypothetical protein
MPVFARDVRFASKAVQQKPFGFKRDGPGLFLNAVLIVVSASEPAPLEPKRLFLILFLFWNSLIIVLPYLLPRFMDSSGRLFPVIEF